MSDDVDADSRAYTVRLELVDRPGELLAALEPIADHGGNLLSIFHERGNITPRGHIPVEVDVECPPDRFSAIVEALKDSGVNVIQAGAERYGEEVVAILVGDLVESDLSDTLSRIEECSTATVVDFSFVAGDRDGGDASARLRIAARRGTVGEALSAVRSVAAEKDLRVVEPVGSVTEVAGDEGADA